MGMEVGNGGDLVRVIGVGDGRVWLGRRELLLDSGEVALKQGG
jgi:hypothetical protein